MLKFVLDPSAGSIPELYHVYFYLLVKQNFPFWSSVSYKRVAGYAKKSLWCIRQIFQIHWQLSLTDILSEPALLYIISWHTGCQQQIPVCSLAIRMGAHGKEIPLDKKQLQIREQPSKWKITLDLLYLNYKPSLHKIGASTPHVY